MEATMEKECSALGGLFQAVINDLKVGIPVWEDFITKATKLHSQLKATILSTTSFLDAFQKIADLATNSRGGTKDVGTALTRICLRHKAVEARMKTFTSALMECLVMPLENKMEDWKKTVAQLDKDHAKEYKRARQEIKKKSSDTLRLQKKVRKGKCEIQRCLDTALQDVSEKFIVLEETEKQALRTALVEERSRFCLFVSYLKPVVDEELAMLSETAHLQEVMELLLTQTADPFTLPASSEQVINELKNSEGSWSFQTPPNSPSSVSSRKSSMCSISSMNSSSSGSTKCHSPGLHMRYRSHSQPLGVGAPLRLPSVSSQDSGFTSQDTLFVRPHTPPPLELIRQMSGVVEQNTSSNASTPSSPYGLLPMATATWPNLQETGQFDKNSCPIVGDRPHTISTAYERGHQRPALTVHTFEPLDKMSRQVNSTPSSPQGYDEHLISDQSNVSTLASSHRDQQPKIPQRASTIERPSVPDKSTKVRQAKAQSHLSPIKMAVLPDFHQPSPNQIIPQPLYVNMDELMINTTDETVQLRHPQSGQNSGKGLQFHYVDDSTIDGKTSHGSLAISSGYGSQITGSEDSLVTGDVLHNLKCLDEATKYCTIPRYATIPHLRPHALNHQRPASTTGYPISSLYGTLQSRTGSLRRSSSQSHKPPPPVRRTSSITSHHTLTVAALRNAQSSHSLDLGSSYSLSTEVVGETMSVTDPPHISNGGQVNGPTQHEQFQCNQVEDMKKVVVGHSSTLPKAHSLTHARKSLPALGISSELTIAPIRKTSLVEESVVINQANLIQSLNARLSQQQQQDQITISQQSSSLSSSGTPTSNVSSSSPPSSSETTTPSLPQSVPIATATTAPPTVESQPLSQTAVKDHGFKENFLQSLNAKLAQHVQKNNPNVVAAPPSPQLQPKSEVGGGGGGQPRVSTQRANFKEVLNAKLTQQCSKPTASVLQQSGGLRSQHMASSAGVNDKEVGMRVRQWMASRVPYDPVICRESLLDQIKQGAPLRKAATNDRSAPRIQ